MWLTPIFVLAAKNRCSLGPKLAFANALSFCLGEAIILQFILQRTKTLRDYTLIGLLATTTHYVLLYTLVDVLQLLDPVPATTIGFLAGACVSFVCNSKFVFKQEEMRATALIKFVLLVALNGSANTLLMIVFVKLMHMQYLLAQCIVTLLLYLSNFVICKLWIFNEKIYAQQP
jgi:putative flippase GtrA